MGIRSLIIDSNNCYIYPMANSLRGGAKASETNIRDLFGVLLSKSSAKTNTDFYPKMGASQNWYTASIADNVLTIEFRTIIGPGKGNCNGYYVDLFDKSNPTQNPDGNTSFTFTKEFDLNSSNIFNLQVYFRIIYSGTGICDGASLWADTEDEANEIYDTELKQYGFYDIGILIGTINIDAQDTSDIKVNYNYNENITNCIDINRLGNANGDYVSQLYNKINRLYNLMLDSGFMTVGTVLQNDAVPGPDGNYYKFNPEPGELGHDFSLVSNNKVQMYIEQTTFPSDTINISDGEEFSLKPHIIQGSIYASVGGTPTSITYNELGTQASFDTVTINLIDGAVSKSGPVTNTLIQYSYTQDNYYSGGIRFCKPDSNEPDDTQDIIKFNSEPCTYTNAQNQQVTTSKITSVSILNDNFVFNDDSLSVSKMITPELRVKDAVDNDYIVMTAQDNKLYIKSSALNESATLYCDNITISNNLYVHNNTNTATITGDRVIGAIWQ